MMHAALTVMKREMLAYFQTQLAYVFLIVFVVASCAFTFYLGNYFGRGVADMEPFFRWHPWLYLFFVPAMTMRLWAEEWRSGTIEVLLCLPVPAGALVVGKFLASWVCVMVALLATFPLWLSANYLGDPDNGVIALSYAGSALMGGAFVAIGSAISACTRNQVIAFIVTACVCFIFTMAGFGVVVNFLQGWLPQMLISAIASMSVLGHFEPITRGLLGWPSLIYFASMMACWLYITSLILKYQRGK